MDVRQQYKFNYYNFKIILIGIKICGNHNHDKLKKLSQMF